MNKQNSVTGSMIYKSLERYVIMAFQMVVQIVIARILSPEHYGIIAMMSVFISVANVFIHTGFNTAVIQKKDATNEDFSTALLINLLIGSFLYLLLFVCTPFIAQFYHEPLLNKTLRVLALVLPIGSVSSIQSAVATRHMHFRKLFVCNVFASVFSGVAGIIAAVLGVGAWALIIQQMSSVIVSALVLTINASWKPSLRFNSNSAKELFGFGWKLLAAGLLNQIYNELNSLVIGRKYLATDMAFYTKGKTFPQTITQGVDNAISTVSLSTFSKLQDNKTEFFSMFRKTLTTNTYILVPILTILALTSNEVISVLLTEKWLPVVPYMQICCLTFALHPMASIDMQAIAAIGRSDVRLKLELIKKPIGILLLILAIPYGPMAIAWSAAVTSIISLVVGAIACQICVGYSFWRHVKDISPVLLTCLLIGSIIVLLCKFNCNVWLSLLMKIVVFTIMYFISSFIFKFNGYLILKDKIVDNIHSKQSHS